MLSNDDLHTRTSHCWLLTRQEAADYLGISKQTLAIWNCTGRYRIPFVKIGRLVKYRKSDLDAFIAGNLKGAC
jgi:excisionase family DNA binding protein